jgi:serine O-acetyltransferase
MPEMVDRTDMSSKEAYSLGRTVLSDFRQDYHRYTKSGRSPLLEPSLAAIVLYRAGQWSRRIRIPIVGHLLRAGHIVLHSLITLAIGIHLPRGAEIGPGLLIYHFGGIWVSASAKLGCNCTLRQNVCIGTLHASDDAPVIGDNVEFGVGSVVIGNIRVGNNVRIGPNAVVMADIPDDSSAFGVPARAVRSVSGIPPYAKDSALRDGPIVSRKH